MSTAPTARSRIVVALDAEGASDLLLDIACQLLRDPATELLGLFVEDRRLLEHATAALAREVAYSGRSRALESATLARQLRARAGEARRRFEARAAQLQVPHDFQVLRGDLVAELVREAATAEALVVGLAADAATTRGWAVAALRELARAPLRAVLFAREAWRTGAGIVTVIDRSADAGNSLRPALDLAQGTRSPLTVLLAADTASEREALARQARALAAAANVDLRACLTVAELTFEATVRAARGARLLVVPRRNEPRSFELLAALVGRTALPLLVVQSPPASDQTA